MGAGRGVSRRETPMVWFARLLCLDHCLPVTPRGVVESLASVLFHHPAKGAQRNVGASIGPQGGHHWRTEQWLPLSEAVRGVRFLPLHVRLCEGMSGVFFCFALFVS